MLKVGSGRFSIAGSLQDIAETILCSVYGGFFGPPEALGVLGLLQALLDCQMEACRSHKLLSTPGPFLQVFRVYTWQHSIESQAFLAAALREPLLEVIAQTQRYSLSLDPLSIWSRSCLLPMPPFMCCMPTACLCCYLLSCTYAACPCCYSPCRRLPSSDKVRLFGQDHTNSQLTAERLVRNADFRVCFSATIHVSLMVH